MKVKQEIREIRIEKIKSLYEFIIKQNEKNKEKLYSNLKKNFDEKETIDLMYKFLENNLSIILKEVKQMYKSYHKTKVIQLKNLLYNEDDKTLNERIKDWFKEYDKDQILNLFTHLCLILDTETFRMIPRVIKEKTEAIYVEIIGDPSDCNGLCVDWIDGEVHLEDDIDLPPYHPDCQCEAVFYEKSDIVNDLEEIEEKDG